MLKEANGAKKTSVLREYCDRFQIDFVVAVRAMEIVEYRALIVNSDKSKKCSLDFAQFELRFDWTNIIFSPVTID